MRIIHKAGNIVKVLKKDGFRGVIFILRTKYRLPIPQSAKSIWQVGARTEIEFWDAYFNIKGPQWAYIYGTSGEVYGMRLDPDLPLQPRLAALLPTQIEVRILDVGAGPITYLGKKCIGKHINITAIDPLSDEYDRILAKYSVAPIVRTRKLAAEDIAKTFPSNTFDLVFARNCIDHAYDPKRAILQMIDVVKRGSYVLLEHSQNEAKKQKYSGFHQWNFYLSADGDFFISSKSDKVNMTKECVDICIITCEIVSEGRNGDWLICRIQKK